MVRGPRDYCPRVWECLDYIVADASTIAWASMGEGKKNCRVPKRGETRDLTKRSPRQRQKTGPRTGNEWSNGLEMLIKVREDHSGGFY